MALTNENKISIATTAARELIKIEVSRLRKKPDESPYKELVFNSVAEIFAFYDIEKETSHPIIQKIYTYEEKMINEELIFEEELNIRKGRERFENTIGYIARTFVKLNEYVGDRIYYICQSYASSKYKRYELEDVFYPIVDKFVSENDIPVHKIHAITSSFSNHKINYEREMDILYLLPKTSWFKNYEQSKHLVENFIETSEKEQEEEAVDVASDVRFNKRMERLLKRFDNKEHIEASKLKRHREELIRILSQDGNFENNHFDSLNIIGLDRLFSTSYIHGRDHVKYYVQEKEISTLISNEDIKEMLLYFEELCLSGDIIETGERFNIVSSQTFKDKDGNIVKENTLFGKSTLTNLKVSVSKHAKWTETENQLFHKFIEIKGFEDLITYSNNCPVVIL